MRPNLNDDIIEMWIDRKVNKWLANNPDLMAGLVDGTLVPAPVDDKHIKELVNRAKAETARVWHIAEELAVALKPFADYFKGPKHDLSPADDNTLVATFLDEDGLPLGELYISDFRHAHDTLLKAAAPTAPETKP